MSFGTPKQCLNKGIGHGYNQRIVNTDEFLLEWGPYRPHIVQKRYCGNDPKLPPGYTAKASLNLCMSKGFAIGSLKKA